MTTYSALTILAGEDAAYAMADAIEAILPEPTGVGAFEIEDGSGLWEVAVYFDQTPDAAALATYAQEFDAKEFVVSDIPDQDWVSKVRRELAPVEAGRFFVYGSHDADKVPEDATGLLIEAAMAFGTGHHGTTLGCLQAFDTLLIEGFAGKRIADVGCGTAVLAMAAAAALDARVLASDIDPVAIDVAVANLAANGMDGEVECVVCAGFDHEVLSQAAPFDLVFANILKGPLIALAPDMGRMICKGGFAILSGILNEQADAVVAAYTAQGFDVKIQNVVNEWTTLVLLRS